MKKGQVSPSSAEVLALVSQGMGTRLHWFPADVGAARLAAVLVGMANTGGGIILLGLTPRSGHLQGIPDVAALLDNVFQAALMADPPLVIPVPPVVQVDNVRIMWITVPVGLPYVYCLDGRYLGREGSQTNPLQARRLRQLLLERGAVQFSTQFPPEAVFESLDPQKVADYIQALHLPGDESPEQILRRRGCTNPEARPNYAALLMFGRYPQQWLPSATIIAARFSGVSLADRENKLEIDGTLPQQLRQALDFIQQNIRQVDGVFEYPLEAVQELVINAIAHRDYNLQGDTIHLNIFSDRLEVQSPGDLPGPVTLENLLEARFSRNLVIVQLLADLGYVERLGYGLNRVIKLLRQHGLRPPRFEVLAGTFRVTLFSNHETLPAHLAALPGMGGLDINDRQRMALDYLARFRRITNRDYQEICPDVHSETLRRDLSDLVALGVIIKVGDKRATYYILKK